MCAVARNRDQRTGEIHVTASEGELTATGEVGRLVADDISGFLLCFDRIGEIRAGCGDQPCGQVREWISAFRNRETSREVRGAGGASAECRADARDI